jgi:long-chain acyl-CoA synthetase
VYKEYQLSGFERITHVLLDNIELSVENGLLTPSMKPQFTSLKKRYLEQFGKLYGQIEDEKRQTQAS